MRTWQTVLSCLTIAIAMPALAMADSAQFKIDAQPLPAALKVFAEQAHMQLLYEYGVVEGVRGHAVNGLLDKRAALSQLLRDTGLEAVYTSEAEATIRPVRASRGGDLSSSSPPAQGGAAKKEGKKSASDRFRLAQANQGAPAGAASLRGATESGRDSFKLEEVVVTAQKRTQRLQDVPVSVSVVNAQSLSENNQNRLREFFDNVPGFTVAPTPTGGNQQVLVLRGINSGIGGNPTVGITVDDVPYGAFTREFAVDLDPNDIKRIEILRGPQGTLYGANSMGGLVKYVTVDPSTDRLSGRIEAGVSGIHNGAQPGFDFRAAINVPLSERVAVRASAFTRQDPGYIDNPVTGKKGVNEDHAWGGRLSALAHLSDAWSLKLSALYQKIRYDGIGEVDVPTAGYPQTLGLGDLQQSYLPGVGGAVQTTQADSAILKGRLGAVEVTSVTGYNVFQVDTTNDYSFLQSATARRLYGVAGAEQFTDDTTRKVTEEIRASIPIGQRVDWLLGGFFSHENNPLVQGYNAEDPATGSIAGSFATLDIPIKSTEYAAFTDITVHFTHAFDIQVGGRESFLHLDFEPVSSYATPTATPTIYPAIVSSPRVFTYLFTPQYTFSPDLMAYVRIASGYRPSRANTFNPDPTVPRTANPDKTVNYEVGVKASTPDHRLTFDAALYYIDWKNIQITLISAADKLSYFTNGSAAKSEGVEVSVAAQPLTGLAITAASSYDKAVLTQAFPAGTAAYGIAGSRLPFSPQWSASLSADQSWPITANLTGSIGLTADYVGNRIGAFVSSPARASYPGYTKLDLRGGCDYGAWRVNVYAKNVTDRRAALAGGAGTLPPFAYYYIQPRTVGMSVTRQF